MEYYISMFSSIEYKPKCMYDLSLKKFNVNDICIYFILYKNIIFYILVSKNFSDNGKYNNSLHL